LVTKEEFEVIFFSRLKENCMNFASAIRDFWENISSESTDRRVLRLHISIMLLRSALSLTWARVDRHRIVFLVLECQLSMTRRATKGKEDAREREAGDDEIKQGER